MKTEGIGQLLADFMEHLGWEGMSGGKAQRYVTSFENKLQKNLDALQNNGPLKQGELL